MADTTRVDLDSLRAARAKLRTVIKQLEEGKRTHGDILHPAYKLGQFLGEALPDAWPMVEEPRLPDYPPTEGEDRP